MTIAIALSMTLFGQALKATDYFPLTPGTKWTYTDSSVPGTEQIFEAKLPVNVGRNDQVAKPAFVIVEKQDGRNPQVFYYRVTPNYIFLVAMDDPRSPLETPEAILKCGDGPQVWTDARNTGASIDPRDFDVVGKSEPKPSKFVFGASRSILEVTFDAKVDGKNGISIHQVATYASGVGLVEMHEVSHVGKKEYKREQKLIKFEPAAGSGGS